MKAMGVRSMIGVLLLVPFLSSCAMTSPKVWSRENTTEAQMKQDDYDCKREAALVQQAPGAQYRVTASPRGDDMLQELMRDQAKQAFAKQCMETKGYRLIEKSTTLPPKATETPGK